jgi:hypothetical protein
MFGSVMAAKFAYGRGHDSHNDEHVLPVTRRPAQPSSNGMLKPKQHEKSH